MVPALPQTDGEDGEDEEDEDHEQQDVAQAGQGLNHGAQQFAHRRDRVERLQRFEQANCAQGRGVVR